MYYLIFVNNSLLINHLNYLKAANNGNVNMVDLFIKANADLNSKSIQQRTALMDGEWVYLTKLYGIFKVFNYS